MCLLGLLGQFLAACDVGCGWVHLGIWLGGAVLVAPSQGWHRHRLAAGSSAGPLAWPVCVCGLCFSQHGSWVSRVPRSVSRDCQTSHRLGLESLGLPGKAHLCGPERAVIPFSITFSSAQFAFLSLLFSCPFIGLGLCLFLSLCLLLVDSCSWHYFGRLWSLSEEVDH